MQGTSYTNYWDWYWGKIINYKTKKSKQTLESAQYRLEVIFKYGREKHSKNGNVDGNRFPRKPIVEYASIVSNRILTDRYWIIETVEVCN